jgi:hypothetical protein
MDLWPKHQEKSNTQKVPDGGLDKFIQAGLKQGV